MLTSPRSRLGSVLSACVLALSMVGGAACTEAGDDDLDFADPVDGSDDSKSDQPDLGLTRIQFQRPLDGDAAHVGVIKSKTAWKQVFGVAAPASINFSKQWVAYYTAGLRSSGGYSAMITRVRLSDTGKSLKISTKLVKPGADCIVTLALTMPYAIVKFDKPAPAPTANRYYSTTEIKSCGNACANGRVETEAAWVDSNDDMECRAPVEHCVTNDSSACPQLSPLPPSFCPDGTIETVPRYLASADGMECSLPTVHCVTRDSSACPQLSPVSPSFCPNGTIETARRYMASADGMECSMPSIHCVTNDASACL